MKADAVSIPSTAVEVSGNRYCGTDNAMPGDFLMALMGVLLQQGSIENSSSENPGGLLFQQGEVVSNGLPAVTMAGLEEIYPQGPVMGVTLPESQTGTKSIPVSGESIPNLLIPWVEPLVTGSGPVALGSMTQPGQAALGLSIPGTAITRQEANGEADLTGEGTGVNVHMLKGGEKGVNVQVQVDNGSSSALKEGPAVLAPQNKAVQSVVSGVITAVQNDEVLPDAALTKGEAPDLLSVKNNLPAGPGRIPGSVVAGTGENEYRTFSAAGEKPGNALPKMQDKKWGKVSNVSPTGQLTKSGGSQPPQVAENGRPEAGQGIRDASDTAGPMEDSAVEAVCIKGSDGTGGMDNDARPGGFELHGEMKISTTTQLSNITGRKLAAEIVPYVMNALKNSGGEKSRVTVLRLKLEPENLGEIKIRLSFAKGELTAHFYTASGLVKDAVEGSLPQLRETLNQYNINLGEANAYVGQEQQNNNGARFGGYNFGGSAGNSGMKYPENLSGDTGDTVSDGNSKSALDLLI